MFIAKIKQIDEIIPYLRGKVTLLCCDGCSQIYCSDSDVQALLDNLRVIGTDIAVINVPYICNTCNIKLIADVNADRFSVTDTLLVVSCGVGVQTVASVFNGIDDDAVIRTPLFNGKNALSSEITVLAACDTYPLSGFQGLTPSNYDCALCGQCHLNDTAGICPITACSKSLINGQCGGAKGGMCEVDATRECGWERINRRL